MKRFLPYILVILLSLPTVISLMKPGYFPMHDDLQAIRVSGMTECFKEFQIPCRWVADMGYGYGYPQFNFYGPLPYYLMSLFNLFGVGIFDSVKLGFALSLILGNLAMYILAISVFKNSHAAFLSTILYAYAPYRASDLYSRGAMGESWAFVFLPLVFFGLKKLAEKPGLKYLSLTGLYFGLLMASHNVSTLVFTPFSMLWGLLLFMQNQGELKNKIHKAIKWLASSVAWGVAVSAFFVLPVIFEKKFAHTESMIGGYFDYRAHFVTIKQLFFTSFWGYGSSEIGPTDDLSFFFSPILLLLISVSLILTIRALLRHQYKVSLQVSFLLFAGLVTTFMSHEKSSVVWSLLKPLIYLQFPWRFLVLANFFFALAAGYCLMKVRRISIFILVPLVVFNVLISLSYFRPIKWLDITEQEKFSGNYFDKQMTISIFDYLPTSADTPPIAPAPILPTSSVKESSISNLVNTATRLSFDFETTKETTLKLNRLYFPGSLVRVNGNKVWVSYSSDGNMFIALTQGKYKVESFLKDTPVRVLGNLLSLVTIPLSILLISRKYYD